MIFRVKYLIKDVCPCILDTRENRVEANDIKEIIEAVEYYNSAEGWEKRYHLAHIMTTREIINIEIETNENKIMSLKEFKGEKED